MLTQTENPSLDLLTPLKEKFEEALKTNISKLGEVNKLRDACEYALLNGGKRIRPLFVQMISDALGHGLDIYEACLSVEYFHTASLIADDLPCMDNDDYRRNKPSLHKIYGETIALLSSYALISAAYEKIFESVQSMEKQKAPFANRAKEACVIALEIAAKCSGISGATGGQFLDLFSEKKEFSDIKKLIYKKTVTLFEVSFVFGWIFGGGEFERIDEIKTLAYHFGLSFQIADDMSDFLQDKQAGNSSNIAICLGLDEAYRHFLIEIDIFSQGLQSLGLNTPSFLQVIHFLSHQAKKARGDTPLLSFL